MAFHYITRGSPFWKLRHAELYPHICSSYGGNGSTLLFGSDKKMLHVTNITKDYSTVNKPQGYPCTKINKNGSDYNALTSTLVNTSFLDRHYHEHNQKEDSHNFKNSIFPAASLYLGAVLLGSSSAFCEAEDTKDDIEEKIHTVEAEENLAGTKSSVPYVSFHHCSRKHAGLYSCSSASKRCCKHDHLNGCLDAFGSVDVASSEAHEERLSSSLLEKSDNLQRIPSFPSHQIDTEYQQCEINSMATNSALHQNSAVHLDGKSDGESSYKQKLQNAISRSTAILKSKLTMCGAVGASVAVMLDGELVWSQGMGYCHVESATVCSCYSKYRIASISKSITATIAMALWEDGLLDLDAPISKYLPDWPKKTVDGKEVAITTHHLLTHSSGIRHYCLKEPAEGNTEKSEDSNNKDAARTPEIEKLTRSESAKIPSKDKSEEKPNLSQDDKRKNFKKYVKSRREALIPQLNFYKIMDEKAKNKREDDHSSDLWEYYINKPYKSVSEAVDLFKDDDLFFTPGTSFLYTSHGYVLLSRVLEAASGTSFQQLAEDFFQNVGLAQTQLDTPRAIVPRRVSCYERDHDHNLRNAPEVNNSYKWAGGGFLSSAVDLVRLGSVLLYSLHATDHMIQEHNVQPGFLKASTVQKMWSPYFYHSPSRVFTRNFMRGYGLGWCVQVPRMDQYDKKSSGLPGPSSGKNSVSEVEAPDDSFVRISTPWGSSRRRSSTVPPEPKELSEDEAMLEQGSKVTTEPDTSTSVKELPGVKSAIQKVSKNTTVPKESHVFDVTSKILPESELETSGWVEGDPIGGRNCRGCCRCSCFAAYHTGAAVGGSSILLIMPQPSGDWCVQRLQDAPDDTDQSGEENSCGEKKIKVLDSGEPQTPTKESVSKDSLKLRKKKDEKVPYRSVMAAHSSWNGCRLCESKCDDEIETNSKGKEQAEVQGVVVAILTNYTGVNFIDEAFKIAREFSAITS
ncbi:Beta-lactamase-related [Trinorchestia longiramus]|nr:Beta-lactamase-related [Trinorchestia longiramus]